MDILANTTYSPLLLFFSPFLFISTCSFGTEVVLRESYFGQRTKNVHKETPHFTNKTHQDAQAHTKATFQMQLLKWTEDHSQSYNSKVPDTCASSASQQALFTTFHYSALQHLSK